MLQIANVTAHELEAFRRKGIAQIDAKIHLSELSKVARGNIIKALETGLYPGAYTVPCHIYQLLADTVALPYMFTRKSEWGWNFHHQSA